MGHEGKDILQAFESYSTTHPSKNLDVSNSTSNLSLASLTPNQVILVAMAPLKSGSPRSGRWFRNQTFDSWVAFHTG